MHPKREHRPSGSPRSYTPSDEIPDATIREIFEDAMNADID